MKAVEVNLDSRAEGPLVLDNRVGGGGHWSWRVG